MCGRYSIHDDIEELEQRFDAEFGSIAYEKRYNASPLQDCPVILNEDPTKIVGIRWGMIPQWMKEKGRPLINIRKETLREKKTFLKQFRSQRCLVLASGFYEWRKEGKVNQPYYFRLKSKQPFAFAGLWEMDTDPKTGDPFKTFAIMTTRPNTLIEPIHDRMPCMLRQSDERAWLKGEDVTKLGKLLITYPDKDVEMFPVSRRVNAAVEDFEDLIRPEASLFA